MLSTTESQATRNPTKEKNDNKEIWLLLIVLILILLILVFVGLILHFGFPKLKESTICLTGDCTLTASEIISAMDMSVNPCDDFYEFSCADFIRKNPVPKHKKRIEIHSHYETFYMLQLRDVIENHFYSKEANVITRMQEAYHVCINTSYHNNKELSAFKEFLNFTMGGWPLAVDNWNYMPTLENCFSNLEAYDIGMQLIKIHLIHNPENGSHFAVGLFPRSPNFSPVQNLQTYSEEEDDDDDDDDDDDEDDDENSSSSTNGIFEDKKKAQKAKTELMLKISQLLGNRNNFSAAKDILEIDNIEEDIQFHLKENKNRQYQKITIKKLNEIFENKINWLNIINRKFWKAYTFTENDEIIVYNWNYFLNLPHILSKYSKRAIINYVGWNIILKLARYAGPTMEDLYYEYKQTINENYLMPARWIHCLHWIQKVYPLALTRIFVDQYIDKNGRAVADEMIELIQEAFKNAIKRSNWLDDETKEMALLKADKLKRFVGYPEFIFNNKLLEEEYKHIPQVHSIHFLNYVNFARNISRKKLSKYGTAANVNTWKNPLMINAYYLTHSNSIWFPSGILQLPFFDDNRLVAVNFGMIGAAIGHEIGHAFDDAGSTFDEKGIKKNWWTNITRETFKKKMDCFISQYNDYCPENLNGGKIDKKICVNGLKTAGENMADNMGLQAAYDGYKLWKQKHGEEKRLPGLDHYSPDQIFFMSYGHLWCENVPPDQWEKLYKFKSHSSGKYRVLGTLSNSKDFSEAFNCPVGTMNRDKERCEIW